MAKLFPTIQLNPIGNQRVRVSGDDAIIYAKTDAAFEYPPTSIASYGDRYESTLHELCIRRAADGVIVPVHEFADNTARVAAGLTFGLINAVVNKSSVRCPFTAKASRVAFELIAPQTLTADQIFVHPAVDPDTSKLHPFKVVVNNSKANAIAILSQPVESSPTDFCHGHFISEYLRQIISG